MPRARGIPSRKSTRPSFPNDAIETPVRALICCRYPPAAKISRRSDRTRERRWHLVAPALLGAAGWVVTVRYGRDTAIALSGMCLAMAGVATSLAQFWSLPTAIVAGAAAATGIALINSIGNLSGFLGPLVIGWLVDRTGSTDVGVYLLAGVMAIGSVLVLTIPARLVNR